MGALGNNFVWCLFSPTVSSPIRIRRYGRISTRGWRSNFQTPPTQWAFYANVGTGYKAGGFSTFGAEPAVFLYPVVEIFPAE